MMHNVLNTQWHDPLTVRDHYLQARPWPWVVMDDFLDAGILTVARAELQKFSDWDSDDTDYVSDHQVHKFYAPSTRPERLESSKANLRRDAAVTWAVLSYLQSPEFCAWISAVTGIADILPDPDWLGGGVHRITSGGFLDIHADFNVHWHRGLHRRLNLLLYLNPDWQESWGGALELWDQNMTQCQHRILPMFNRAVLFRITDDAYHGHPDPVRSPAGQDRLSLAIYYYTQERPDHEKSPQHPVIWAQQS